MHWQLQPIEHWSLRCPQPEWNGGIDIGGYCTHMPIRGSHTGYWSYYSGGTYGIGWSTYGAIRGNEEQNVRFAPVGWFAACETLGVTEGCSCYASSLVWVTSLYCILFVSCLGGDLWRFSLSRFLKTAAWRVYLFNRRSKVGLAMNFLYWEPPSSDFHLPSSGLFGLKVLYRLGARGPIWPVWGTGRTGGAERLPAKLVCSILIHLHLLKTQSSFINGRLDLSTENIIIISIMRKRIVPPAINFPFQLV
jgi:hypothetical protein